MDVESGQPFNRKFLIIRVSGVDRAERAPTNRCERSKDWGQFRRA